jgi:hypothetical protein
VRQNSKIPTRISAFRQRKTMWPNFYDLFRISRYFPQNWSVDRGQLRQGLPESISRGCFPHLQGAPSEPSRPRTQVAFPSRDPGSSVVADFSELDVAPVSSSPARVRSRSFGCSRPSLRAISRARSSTNCGVTVPNPSIPRRIFPLGDASSIVVFSFRAGRRLRLGSSPNEAV